MIARVCGDDRDPYVRILDALELHQINSDDGGDYCGGCFEIYPCPTLRALTGNGRYPNGDDRQVTP